MCYPNHKYGVRYSVKVYVDYIFNSFNVTQSCGFTLDLATKRST